MSTITYTVTVADAKFLIDDAVAPKLSFRDGDTYVFDQADSSNAGHILQFSITSNNSGGAEYTTGVTKTGTPGSAGAKTTIVTSGSTTDTLYFYSSGGGTYGEEFSNSGFKTSTNFNFLKPIVGAESTAEKWGPMVNHMVDQIDQNISGQDLDGATDSGTVAVDLDSQSLTVAGSNGIATSGTGQTITVSGEALAFQGQPHIIPDVLYPAVAGKLLDGSTSHGATYGVAQGDGRSYYYTDIKGSKPIKDPRIGSHFGSQRHKFKSLQLLEQETATHGSNVYSVDGREWARVVGPEWVLDNGSYASPALTNEGGNDGTTIYFEVVAYCNYLNFISYTATNYGKAKLISIDGSADSTTQEDFTAVATPLAGRFVDAGSVIPLKTASLSLGIHTFRVGFVDNIVLYGIELIAQDTSNVNNIQIPSQNVVSYGKKFTVAGTPHYNPFGTKGDDSASTIPNNTTGDSVATGWTGATSAYWDSSLDTATSLGLGAWVSGGNYYRPVNGGRVVKWVDSSGNIKTSVNMMPPEAQSIIGTTSISSGVNAPTGTHNWSTQYQPQFGHRTIGSNLITSWANTSYPFETLTTSGANITQATNTTSAGEAVSNSLGLTVGKLYKISISSYDHTSGTAMRIYTGNTGINANGSIPMTVLTDDADSTHTFIASTSDTYLTFGTQGSTSSEVNTINFTLYEIEDPSTQAEVAKTFHAREFGNGSANGDAAYADATIVFDGATDIAYVMDDGLTSLSGDNFNAEDSASMATYGQVFYPAGTGDSLYITFIGTGATITAKRYISYSGIVQNLPYGTHILRLGRDSGSTSGYSIDGVDLGDIANGGYGAFTEISFHQPKMPPIPEDAVVIADYMLMADYVKQTDCEPTQISKGVRYCNGSRDHLSDTTGAWYNTAKNDSANSQYGLSGFHTPYPGGQNASSSLPFFGTTAQAMMENSGGTSSMTLGGSATTETALDSSVHANMDMMTIAESVTLGMTNVTTTIETGGKRFFGHHVATPIHTSSHYQTFETPFLHELVGGDRNMEQTNLVVTPDGKTWDQVTRDVSYIGNIVLRAKGHNNDTAETVTINDEWRGTTAINGCTLPRFNKDFAIAYDRMICLKDGFYNIIGWTYTDQNISAGSVISIMINGVHQAKTYVNDFSSSHPNLEITPFLKRGDYVQWYGVHDEAFSNFEITRA